MKKTVLDLDLEWDKHQKKYWKIFNKKFHRHKLKDVKLIDRARQNDKT